MKRFNTILTVILITASAFISQHARAQAPEKMSYQAVIRDANGELVKETQIGLQISILKDSVDGTVIYVESHTPQTNKNGLVTVEIGTGVVLSGGFSEIDWQEGAHFIKTAIDIEGGTNYTLTSTNQLLSVPYAFHANTADSLIGTITETQNLANVLKQGNDGGALQIKNIADPTDNQDAVTLSFVRNIERRLFELEFDLGKDSVYDCEGNVYHIVKIGDQYWFKENLKTVHFSNCDTIPNGIYMEQYETGPFWFVYDDDLSNLDIYGRLYTYYAAIDKRNICPKGWHVSTLKDWDELVTFLGGYDIAGGKIKETGTLHWESPNAGATNESGFTALPGGTRRGDSSFGRYEVKGLAGYFWLNDTSWFNNKYVYSDGTKVTNANYNGAFGFSVRCVKD